MTRTVQILKLEQPRCTERYGVGSCLASGATKCMNTHATCDYLTAYNTDGKLVWWFSRPGDPVYLTADRPDDDEWHGPCIPILSNVSVTPTRVNIGAVRDSETPLGIRGTITVTLSDMTFRNQFGDFYDRSITGSLSRLWQAWVGEAAPQMVMTLYSGTSDQSIDEMTARRFDVDVIQPPSGGTWQIDGIDPLGRVNRRKAKFPRETDLSVYEAVNTTSTSISLFGAEDDISDAFGNTSTSYVRLGDEIVSYTGYSAGAESGVWDLSGVGRNALGTEPESHEVDDPAQRVGYFHSARYYAALRYILADHTTLTEDLLGDWDTEGNRWLSLLTCTGATVESTDVWDVASQMMRDGMFTLFWNEVSQSVEIIALRQPTNAQVTLSDRSSIVAAEWVRYPDQRMTRVIHLFDMRNPTGDTDKISNFRTRRERISITAESDDYADGSIRSVSFSSRYMRAPLNALLVQASLLQRYERTPEYLQLTLTAKDASLTIGDVVEVDHSDVVDRVGVPLVRSWQLIQQPEEVTPQETYRVVLQSFTRYERPAFFAENDAPDFDDATGDDLLNTCYITENDGSMPDGSTGWVIQ